MRILIANYRYFLSGGPERYMFSVADALTRRNHEVIPFSVKYSRNQVSKYSKFFAKPLGNIDEVYFREHEKSVKILWSTLSRLFYATDVEKLIDRLIFDSKPQIAYVLHYLRKLSPSLLVGLKKRKIPIVVRLSDFAMLCPQAHCLRDGLPCELCISGNIWPSVRYGCVQKSRTISLVNAIATWYHRNRRFFDLIDVFIATTEFMYQMMITAGISKDRIKVIPTFVDLNAFTQINNCNKRNYVVYSGRIEEIKGVHTLIDAYKLLKNERPGIDLQLKIAGSGDSDYLSLLANNVQSSGLENNIHFLGEISTQEISKLLGKALVAVLPSLWYENLPNTVLESFACGTPVIASNIGSLPEIVINGKTGFLFKTGDASSLAEQIAICIDHPDKLLGISSSVRAFVERNNSANNHLSLLEELFKSLL